LSELTSGFSEAVQRADEFGVVVVGESTAGGVEGLTELSSQLLLVVLGWWARIGAAAARLCGDVAVKDCLMRTRRWPMRTAGISARSIMFRKV
jgi:hypothetical protein